MIDVKKMAVLGAGIMGNGIAQVSAQAGISVKMVDINDGLLKRGFSDIRKSLDILVKKRKIDAGGTQKILSLISGTTNLKEAVADADMVIEAVPEDLVLKQNIFKQLDALCPEHTLLVTNTSTISISAIASVTRRPEKVIGLHFANPVPVMVGVEVIKGIMTSEETLESSKRYLNVIGKEYYIARDAPGFIGNRLLPLFINEAFNVLWEGIATAEDIDKSTKLSFRHPMGPFELADLIGLDQLLKGLEYMHQEYGERYRPSPMLKQLVAAGYYGRKTGRGVFIYK